MHARKSHFTSGVFTELLTPSIFGFCSHLWRLPNRAFLREAARLAGASAGVSRPGGQGRGEGKSIVGQVSVECVSSAGRMWVERGSHRGRTRVEWVEEPHKRSRSRVSGRRRPAGDLSSGHRPFAAPKTIGLERERGGGSAMPVYLCALPVGVLVRALLCSDALARVS